jgi:ribonuclease HI/probable phosphoglycerate mutase
VSEDSAAGETYTVYADGASRGNPGPAAIGVVVLDPAGRQVHTTSRSLGRATNNQAEYRAAIAGLEAALGLGARQVELRMDSELVVRQLSGRYRVRNPRLIPLNKRMLDLRSRFQKVAIRHVPRGENALADKLANQALDNVSHQEPPPARQRRFDFPRQ